MRSPFLFSLLAAASTMAMAQSTVTLYGIADVGVTAVSGLRDGTAKQLVSGIMEGSRFGVRGDEDLGGGYRVLFTLEHRLELDFGGISNRPVTGSQLPDRVLQAVQLGLPLVFQPVVDGVAGSLGSTLGVNLNGAFWDRQAFIAFVTPVGGILAGRQYTPAYEVIATFDTLGTQSPLAAGQVGSIPATVDIRANNSLAYRIRLGGLSAVLMVTAAEGSTTTGRLIGLNAIYKGKGYSVGLGHNTRENELGQTSLTSTIVGGTLDIGPGTVSAMVGQITDDNPTGVSSIGALVAPQVGAANGVLVQSAFTEALKQDAQLVHVGYKMTTGVNTFYVAYTQLDDKRASDADTRSYGVAYTYSLSKRTDLNASVTRFDNSGLGQAAPGAAGYLGGVTASAGTDSTSVALGIRHRF
jgi:predicted porin